MSVRCGRAVEGEEPSVQMRCSNGGCPLPKTLHPTCMERLQEVIVKRIRMPGQRGKLKETMVGNFIK